MKRRLILAALTVSSIGSRAMAQRPDSTRCDSIVAAAAVDSVATSIFVSVNRVSAPGPDFTDDERDLIAARLVHGFVPPSPFRLSVFAGPPRMRGLRIAGGDSLGATRAPSVVGVYVVTATATEVGKPEVLRSSMMHGLDSAMINAIASSSDMWRVLQKVARTSLRVQVRLSDDSTDDSRSLAWGTFPRMPVHDAVPLSANPAPAFPKQLADSVDHGEVVLRFAVDRDGRPAMETIEIVRTSGLAFTRAAIGALPDQKFTPATIRGCPVAQLVDYPFIFDASQRPPSR